LLSAVLHAWQLSPQVESQHTPSTQYPFAHSLTSVHDSPSPFLVAQVLVVRLQYASLEQSVSAAHDVLHASVSQAYGAQGLGVALHPPPPSQVLPVTVPAVHDVAPQAMPIFAYLRQRPLPSHIPSSLHEVG
jgi:hypothetical protein